MRDQNTLQDRTSIVAALNIPARQQVDIVSESFISTRDYLFTVWCGQRNSGGKIGWKIF
jgi:hypothetical protein